MTFYRIQAVDKNYQIHDLDMAYFDVEPAAQAITSGQVVVPEWAVALLVVESIEREVRRFVRKDEGEAFESV